jgi:enoyl-CoA hydratase/carnithine racemase
VDDLRLAKWGTLSISTSTTTITSSSTTHPIPTGKKHTAQIKENNDCICKIKTDNKHRYPMPTIALINGHGFAGALMTAMMHDYRIMNPHRGYICLNEVELGIPLTPAMSSIFRQKCSAQTYRTLVLEGKRFNALAALGAGVIDGVGGLDEVVAFVDELALVKKTDKGIYGLLKQEMWRETVGFLDAPEQEVGYKDKVERQRKEMERLSEKRVKDWENAKAKL